MGGGFDIVKELREDLVKATLWAPGVSTLTGLVPRLDILFHKLTKYLNRASNPGAPGVSPITWAVQVSYRTRFAPCDILKVLTNFPYDCKELGKWKYSCGANP